LFLFVKSAAPNSSSSSAKLGIILIRNSFFLRFLLMPDSPPYNNWPATFVFLPLWKDFYHISDCLISWFLCLLNSFLFILSQNTEQNFLIIFNENFISCQGDISHSRPAIISVLRQENRDCWYCWGLWL
jgi:hypothetical protein